jgi:hypothetical protein
MKPSFLAGGLAVLALSLPCAAQELDPSTLPGIPEPKVEVKGDPPRKVTLPEYDPPCPPAVIVEPTIVGIPVTGPEYPHLWADFDALLWWMKANNFSGPLVTTIRAPEDLAATVTAGGLADPNAAVLFGDQPFRRDPQAGGRLTVGAALDPEGSIAFEASGFYLPLQVERFFARSDAAGNPALALPFIDVFPGPPVETAAIIAGPFNGGVRTGFVLINNGTELWGADANLVKALGYGWFGEFDLLAGVRYLQLRDILTIDAATDGGGSTDDRFETRNEFVGGQLGLRHVLEGEWWRVQTTAKFALGDSHQTLDINGTSGLPLTAAGVTLPGGFYTAGSNIGRTHTDRLAFVQETGVNLTYKMTDCVQLTVGYTFLYWNHVYRSGNQIDRSINPALNPAFSVVVPPGGPQQPQRLNAESSFWAQGINLGFRVTF